MIYNNRNPIWAPLAVYFAKMVEYILPRVVYPAEMAVKPPFLIFAFILKEISVLHSQTSYIVFPFLKNSFLIFFSFDSFAVYLALMAVRQPFS